MRKFSVGLIAGAATTMSLIGTGANASVVTLYDSGGFSAPRFTANSALEGQDGGKWEVANFDPNNIQATVIQFAASTDQGVALSRGVGSSPTNAAGFWFVNTPFTPTALNNVVTVDWQMRIDPSQSSGLPFFGIQAFKNSNGALTDQIGSVGIDAGNGNLLVASGTGTNEFGGVGGFHDNGTAFHKYHVAFNFTTQAFQITVDGNQIGGDWTFQNPATTFSDADLHTYDTTLPTVADPTPVSSGLAYFDDFLIQATPEPSGLLLAGLALPGLLARRRRR